MNSLLKSSLAPLLVAALAASAGAGQPPSGKAKSEKAQQAAPKRAKAKPAPRPAIKVAAPDQDRPKDKETARVVPPATARKPQADEGLAPLGALTVEEPQGSGLLTMAVVPGSEAESMGLAAGDKLTHLGPLPVRTRAEAQERMRGLPTEGRLSAVVIRGLVTQILAGKPQPAAPPATRGPDEISAHEVLLKEGRLASVQSDAEAAVRNAPPQEFRLAAGQTLWIRFSKGVAANAGPGDIVQGEATTAICTDQSLDFLSLPPKTVFWAKVLDAAGPAQTANLRLFFFKMKLNGGSFYPIAARVADISGDSRLVRVTPGGTIVLAPGQTVHSDMKVKIELLEPVTLVEPPGFYSTGVGLWIKSREDGPGFRISHIIPGRAAEAAGLQPGDVIMSIDGAKASAFDFASAVSAIYGRQESEVKLGVVRSADLGLPKAKVETLSLKRGVILASGNPEVLPPPYAEKAGHRR
ncbi:MAG: PDZ domain-containing protein [Elusimicrobia bacterium]|nr:PDZ domain-containing protein [Elusimicrobiota bacterium]